MEVLWSRLARGRESRKKGHRRREGKRCRRNGIDEMPCPGGIKKKKTELKELLEKTDQRQKAEITD